ncbi:GDP-L-fucose synthase [compost metagenome]
MNKSSRIYVAGHRGLVGSAIVRRLENDGYENLLLRTSKELDLRVQQATFTFFEQERPEYVFLAAAKVGGILANDTYPADFISENLAIQQNVIQAAHQYGVTKLLFLGSSCIYPKMSPQPIKEEYLLTGPLEPTNEWYAIAKIAGIKLCQAYNKQYGTRFISAMPTNLYGPNDNFDLVTSHVLPAMIRKFHEAKVKQEAGQEATVTLWGSGAPRREFLHVDDLADACLHLMKHYEGNDPINVGTGEDVTIRELAETIAEVVGFKGKVIWDASKPDGTPRKLLDVCKLQDLGWNASKSLELGIKQTYRWYIANMPEAINGLVGTYGSKQ